MFRALHGQSEVKVDHRLSLLGGRTHKRKKKPDVMYPQFLRNLILWPRSNEMQAKGGKRINKEERLVFCHKPGAPNGSFRWNICSEGNVISSFLN